MRSLFPLLFAVAIALLAPLARADVYVVVNAANPVHAMAQKEVIDLYMGRSRAYASNELALALDLPRDHPMRTAFYNALTGLSTAQVNSYWARLMFSGRTMPPQQVASEQAMEDLVRRNPSAIGYLAQEPADHALRVVLVLKEHGEHGGQAR